MPTASYTASTPPQPLSAADDLSPAAAEEHLRKFRDRKLRYFPFIYIPETTTAAELQRQRPFLWTCIVSSTTLSTAHQLSLGLEIRRSLAQTVVVEQERSLDMFLGLVCILGMPTYQMGHKPYLFLYTQIANALMVDLHIHRPPLTEAEGVQTSCFKNHAWQKAHSHLLFLPRTMEERRAVLAHYLSTAA